MITPKVRILKRNLIDDTRWNSTVREAVNSLPYGYTWYLDALCSRWVGVVVGDYDFVMPLPIGRKWGLLYVYQPLFCQQLGIFYRRHSDTIIVLLLNTAINFANNNKLRVYVVSIPDYSVTPFATGLNQVKIATEINQFNMINKEESAKAGVNYVDITPISRQAATDPTLIAPDGLHPSAKMYGLWITGLNDLLVKSL